MKRSDFTDEDDLNETGENKMKMTVIMCYLRMKFVE
jgi:hypothetical protein